MRLLPDQPPGNARRKARDFGPEIARLYAQGYSCEVIRVALVAVGVCVDRTTVWREAKRAIAQRATVPSAAKVDPTDSPQTVSKAHAAAAASPPAPPIESSTEDPRTGKERATDFFAGQITNSLIRARTRK